MRAIARLVAEKYAGKLEIQQRRVALGGLEGWISIGINILLFVFKLIAGLWVGSAALIADAVHTLSDSASSVVVLLGFKLSAKPSDRRHPFGHGRMEYIATLVVAVLLFVAAIEMFINSYQRIGEEVLVSVNWWVISLVAVTVAIKDLMARFSEELGKIISSQTLIADARHHRSDAISTLLVIVALIASKYGFYGIDGYIGMGVSLMIFWSGYEVAVDAVDSILGAPPSRELIQKIEAAVGEFDEVLGVHDIMCHNYGNKNVISMHIELNSQFTALAIHTITERVESKVEEYTGGTVVIHADPVNNNHREYGRIKEVLNSFVVNEPSIRAIQDLRVIGENLDSCSVIAEIKLVEGSQDIDEGTLKKRINKWFKESFPKMELIIKIDRKPGFEICR